MVLLEKLWDDVVAGPHPDRGLDKLRTLNTQNLSKDENVAKYQRSTSMPTGGVSTSASPGTPSTPVTPSTPTSARKENVWRSVFHPGSNVNTKTLGAHIFDKPTSSSSPTVYDWLYSGESRSRHF
ncbi:hypothetical protein vseg_017484 [Gypsophila vaccaria]